MRSVLVLRIATAGVLAATLVLPATAGAAGAAPYVPAAAAAALPAVPSPAASDAIQVMLNNNLKEYAKAAKQMTSARTALQQIYPRLKAVVGKTDPNSVAMRKQLQLYATGLFRSLSTWRARNHVDIQRRILADQARIKPMLKGTDVTDFVTGVKQLQAAWKTFAQGVCQGLEFGAADLKVGDVADYPKAVAKVPAYQAKAAKQFDTAKKTLQELVALAPLG